MTAVETAAITVLDAALEAWDAGLCVVRAQADGSKRPVGTWKRYQQQRPDRATVHDWFAGGHPGIGILTGSASGGVEMLEFEGRAVDGGVLDQFIGGLDDAGLTDLWNRIVDGWSEWTPSGGVHVYYRIEPSENGELDGNAKLALDPATGCLIETRGEGGFSIIGPSHGPVHPSGKAWTRESGGPATMATITREERAQLFALCAEFDVAPARPSAPDNRDDRRPARDHQGESWMDRVREHVNRTRNWSTLLSAEGFTFVKQDGDEEFWRHPAATAEHSITINATGRDTLINFSTSLSDKFTPWTGTGPAPSYDKLDFIAAYRHGGDRVAAARAEDPNRPTERPSPLDEDRHQFADDEWNGLLDSAAAAEDQPGSSYRPVCMANVRSGDVPPPTVLTGIDGDSLFYPGRTNMLMAESEAGKTWLAYHAAHQVLDDNGRVLVLDYEDEGATFKARMLSLGVSELVINDPQQVVYVRPEGPLWDHKKSKITADGIDFSTLLEQQFELVIIDGVTDAMQLEGFDPNSNAELAIWNTMVPKRIARQTGAATVMLDHYGKMVGDPRYAIGGQHKRGMITGASYGLEVVEPIGRGKAGGGRFIVGKDRPGYVRGRSTKIDRGMLVAATYSVDHDELTGAVRVRVEPFLSAATHPDQLAVDMPLVRSLYDGLLEAAVPLSGRAWKGTVKGRDDRKQGAMEWLVGKGYVLKQRSGRADLHLPNPSKPKDW